MKKTLSILYLPERRISVDAKTLMTDFKDGDYFIFNPENTFGTQQDASEFRVGRNNTVGKWKVYSAFPLLGSLPLLPEPPEEDTDLPIGEKLYEISKTEIESKNDLPFYHKDNVNIDLCRTMWMQGAQWIIKFWQATPKKFTEKEVIEFAWDAWKSAANAYRMYPENKHTFSAYRPLLESQLSSLHPRPSQLIFDDTDMVDENGYLKVERWVK